MNVFAKFGEIPSWTLQDIKETKRFGHTFVPSDGRTDGRTDNVKTVYPPTNIVCGGYIYKLLGFIISICLEDRNVFARFDEIPSMTL